MDFSSEEALAASLEDLATGYMPAAVLFATVELGVFDALAEPRTTAQLAERIGCGANGLERLLRVLGQLGLATRDGDRWSAPAMVRSVLSPAGIAGTLRFHHRQVAPLLARLAEGVRSGAPQHAAWPFADQPPAAVPYVELARHPSEYATFMEAMDRGSRGVGRAIAAAPELAGVKLLLDFGGGSGVVARELLQSLPALTVESYDVAAACSFARARSEAAGLGARHLVREGDLLAGVDRDAADAVLLSAILADWRKEERATILHNAHRALKPGGCLLVSETLLDDHRRGPLKPAMLSLVMLVAMRGDQLSGAELVSELEAAGFTSPEVRRGGPRDLIVARR
jgi:predicted O-methyltransferase YrrM